MEIAVDDTDSLPNEIILKTLHQLLIRKFPKRKFSYILKKATKKGDNYLGVVHRSLVSLEKADDGHSENFSLILKVPPKNAARRKQFFARPCFLRESLAYEQFLPLVRSFQKRKGISDVNKNGFHEYAECYCAITDEMNEAIFMEDLCVQKFELFDRFAEMSRNHVALVMRIYAKLHAVSFAIKDQQPEDILIFQQMKNLFEQRKNDQQLGAYFEELKQSTLACLDAMRDHFYVDILQKYFKKGKFFELLLPLIDGKLCEGCAVVCHGDCWNNNILFKYENGAVMDARLIDWQLMRYASPTTDLMYFLFTCTNKEFRRQHFHSMLDIYYQEVTSHIERLGSDANQLFPRSTFEAELISKGAVGLLLAMMVLPIMTIKSEDAPDLEELSAKIEAGDTTDLRGSGLLKDSNASNYRTRMRDTVLDCIDFGFI